ncbi:transcriptional regulator [Salibacterium salarium]|uniref:Transcriptional regulator n=1 Tax=Salibacterium salarium TaxID=284579 RepID=A0A428N2F4_9BACI|nr:ArpU family phage packaging/lysis transcriptional regulator [Salibacterium salarium]RSL32655.1 transcriptional regulator [Salibacterium salarium]
MSFELPQLDRTETKRAVEETLERYRIFKYLSFEEKEVSITSSYEERLHGPTNETSDQVAKAATYNVDEPRKRQKYCERIERAVRRLPKMERKLIEERYMTEESEYITDYAVYCHRFDPPISERTYRKIRWKAFYKLALNLNLPIIQNSYEKM